VAVEPRHAHEHWRETGLLAGEAALNSFVVVEGLKYPLGRQRPFQGMAAGTFPGWHIVSRRNTPLPLGRSGVIAHEYPESSQAARLWIGGDGGTFHACAPAAFSLGRVRRQRDR